MKAIELTQNEKAVLVALVNNAKKVGDNDVEFIIADVAKYMDKNVRSISATVGSLAKKGMVLTANGESYFDGVITESGLHEVENMSKVKQEVETNKTDTDMEDKNFDAPAMDERIVKLNELKSVKMAAISKSKRPAAKANKAAAQYILDNWDNTENLQRLVDDEEQKQTAYESWAIADSRLKQLIITAAKADNERKEKELEAKKAEEAAQAQKEASTTAQTDEADKVKTEKKKAAKTARKVGDLHPNGKWVWTEYAPGKFDWRTIPSLKQQGKRTDVTKKQATKKPASKAKKAEEPKKAEKPTYTIDEWVALPSKASHAKSKMSEAQKEAFKLINKGYRITADKKFFKAADGTTKACNWASVEAMLKRYGIDYVPMGLIMEDKNEK